MNIEEVFYVVMIKLANKGAYLGVEGDNAPLLMLSDGLIQAIANFFFRFLIGLIFLIKTNNSAEIQENNSFYHHHHQHHHQDSRIMVEKEV